MWEAILARQRQRENPILACIRRECGNCFLKKTEPYGARSTLVDYVPDEQLSPDFMAGPDTAVLFISLRFQRVHQDYLARRLKALGAMGLQSLRQKQASGGIVSCCAEST